MGGLLVTAMAGRAAAVRVFNLKERCGENGMWILRSVTPLCLFLS